MTDSMACPECGSEDLFYNEKREEHICKDCSHVFDAEEYFVPRRIFLSYGHDKHAALAQRMKADLVDRGHEVWFDLERLKPGGDWEAYIEEGIEWVGAGEVEGRVVLLMTPHSVRRPDGYCLNEIARALSRSLSVVPVMVVWCEPPLSICRVQWLDMQDCVPVEQRGERYEARFERLVEALEQNRLDFEGTQTRLKTILEPLPFDADIEKHLERFTGREWVFDAIDVWLDQPNESRVFWLQGAPGVGKSAVAAWLIRNRREVAAFHLCRHGHTQKADPRATVKSIAYQLSTQLPDYQDRLGAENLDQLVPESDARTLFDRLVVQPLSSGFQAPDRTIIVLIDGLDEASADGRNELARFISTEWRSTPDWLRLIVTSRPEPEVTHPLQGLDPYVLDASEPRNLDDIRLFLCRELANLAETERVLEEAIEAIVERSEGVFLYAEWVRQELAAGRLSLDRLDEFPQGLGEVYAEFFARQFPDERQFAEQVRPALEIVAAASEPLSLAQIGEMLDWDEYAEADFVEGVGSLFAADEEIVRPFHRSVMDWLTDRQTAGRKFLVSEDAGHRRLADHGWEQYQAGKDGLSGYWLAHLPDHLIAVERWNAVTDLLTSEAYVTRLEGSEVTDAHQATAVFMQAVSSLPTDHLEALWRGPHFSATLALKGIGMLVDLGRLDVAEELVAEAREHIEARPESDLCVRWLLLSSRLHLNAGDLEQAEGELTRALELARSVAFCEGVAKALLGLGVIIRRSKDRRDTAHEALLGALRQDFSDQDADLRARVNLNLAIVYTLRGDRQQAEEALGQARIEIQKTDNPLLEAWLWKYGGFVALLSDREAASKRFTQAAAGFAEAGNPHEAEACGLLAVFSMGDLTRRQLHELLTAAPRVGGVSRDVVEGAEASLRELDSVLETAVPAEAEAEAASQIVRKATQAAMALEREVGGIGRRLPPSATMDYVKWLEEALDRGPPMGRMSPTETALSIGMVVSNRDGSSEFCPIIQNGTPYPAYGTRHFFLWHGREVVLPIYASDKTEPVIEDLVELGRLTVDCSEEDTVVVEMEMHSDRLLSVTASCHNCRDSVEIPLGQ